MKTRSQPEALVDPLPEDFERAVELTRPELEHHLRLMAALKMFELGKISSGKAAELAGMGRVDFFETCGRYRVPIFNYPPEEIEKELRRDLETLQTAASAAEPSA
jgi:predicted HTH domain antitoxin